MIRTQIKRTSSPWPLAVLCAAAAFAVLVQQPQRALACPVGGCTNASLYGDYTFSASSHGGAVNVAVVGVLHADGAGNLTGTQTNTDDSSNPINVLTLYICNSTYSINSDGTGTASFNVYTDLACTMLAATPTVALALEDGGHGFRVMNNSGSLVFTGSARLQ